MDHIPNASSLTAAEFASLRFVAPGFVTGGIPAAHQTLLIKLGLIQSVMGGLMATPAGRMAARI
jgi:hypothetical protein